MSSFGKNKRVQLGVEVLEAREVPATAVLNPAGVLRIVGTEKADIFRVRHSGGYISLDGGKISTPTGTVGRVSEGSVKRIEVYGVSGDDRINLGRSDADAVRIGSHVYGGDGNDGLIGGKGADMIDGGGTRLLQTASQHDGVDQLLPGVDPATGQATTLYTS